MSTPAEYTKPITTLAEARAFIEVLHRNGDLFHFEDDVRDIMWRADKSAEEIDAIDARRNELYSLDWPEDDGGCPIGYALQVMKRAGEGVRA